MTLSELVATVGEDNIAVQSLDECAVDFSRAKGNEYRKVAFITQEEWDFRKQPTLEKFGLVLWIDRDKIEKLQEALKGEATQ